MTDQEIIIEVAKLDGFEDLDYLKKQTSDLARFWHGAKEGENKWTELPNYITSRDAIVPAIEKNCKTWDLQDKFLVALNEQIVATEHSSEGDIQWLTILATPRQLCIALLKATGKYK